MEFNYEGNTRKYEDANIMRLPIGFSFDDEDEDEDDSPLASPRTSCMSVAYSVPVCPMSPYTRSPMRTYSSPTLLYDCLASLHFSKGNICSVTVTNGFVFTGSSRIRAWKLPDCTEMGSVKSPSGEIRAMLAYGKLIFTVHGDFRIRAWEISPGESFGLKKTMTLPRRRRKPFFSFLKKDDSNHQHDKLQVSCLAYNDKEKILFTGSINRTVNVWRISEKRRVESFIAHEGRVNAIVTNEQDGCVFTCSCDGTLKMWRRISRESSHVLITVLMFQPAPINALALSLSPSRCFLYSGSSDGTISFWEKDKVSGRYNRAGFLNGHHFAVLCLAMVGDFVLSGSEDATVRIWKRENGNQCFHSSLAVIDGHHGPVKCLAAAVEADESVENLLVCSASLDQTLKVWRVEVNRDRVEDSS